MDSGFIYTPNEPPDVYLDLHCVDERCSAFLPPGPGETDRPSSFGTGKTGKTGNISHVDTRYVT